MISSYPGSSYPGYYWTAVPTGAETVVGAGGASWDVRAAGIGVVTPRPEGVGLGGSGRKQAPAYLFRRQVVWFVVTGAGGAVWQGTAHGVGHVGPSLDLDRELRIFAALDMLDQLDEVLHSIALLEVLDG